MHKYSHNLIFACLVPTAFAIFSFGFNAEAAVIFDNLTDSKLDSLDIACKSYGLGWQVYGDPNVFPCGNWRQSFGISSTTTPFQALGKLSSLTVKGFTQPEIVDCFYNGNDPVTIRMDSADGGQHFGKSNLSKQALCNLSGGSTNRNFTDITFYFDPSDTIDFSTTVPRWLFTLEGNTPLFLAQTAGDSIQPSTYPDGNAIYKYCNIYDCGGGRNPIPDVAHDIMVRMETDGGPTIPAKTPVLIVPGILGTEMYRLDVRLWPNLAKAITDIGDEFMNPLAFSSSLSPSDSVVSIGEVLVNPNRVYNYTESLINEFKTEGYQEGTDLFTFPYDWRYGVSGNNITALKDKIDAVLSQTHATQVDVVAHSTGGLLIKKYIQENQSAHHIKKAVFVGVPNTGAPKAVKVLVAGDSFGVPGLSNLEMKKIAANLPVAYQLLPSQAYFDHKGSFVTVLDHTIFGNSPKQLDFEQTKNFLIGDHQLNNTALASAQDLHSQGFDDFDLTSAGVELSNIVGCKTATIGKVEEVRSNLGAEPQYRLGWVPGDGTVPLESATNLPINDNNRFYAFNVSHGTMMTEDGVRQKIVQIISGDKNIQVPLDKVARSNIGCNLNGRAISIYSPVDIYITDNQGHNLGLAQDDSLVNNIPGADFNTFGQEKFVFLPTDKGQNYDIALKGTGDGAFTLKNEQIVEGQTQSTEVFIDLPVTKSLVGQMQFGSEGTTLNLDNNGDGLTDRIVRPDAVLDQNQSEDVVPPTINFMASQSGNSFLQNDVVSFTLSCIDELSGVLSCTAGQPNKSLDITSLGNHSLIIKAVDRAGNKSQQVFSYDVFGFSGLFQPINLSSKDFKKNSTLPIKFQLSDGSGNFWGEPQAKLYIDGIAAVSSGGANIENQFRYNSVDQQYIFNLSTAMTLFKPGSTHSLKVIINSQAYNFLNLINIK